MHNIITKDDRAKDVDFFYYDLIGVPVQAKRRQERPCGKRGEQLNNCLKKREGKRVARFSLSPVIRLEQ
jgi:hypothetical protein